MWVRLESQPGDGASSRGTLLNEPYSDFGMHEGEMVAVCFAEDEEGQFLVAEAGSRWAGLPKQKQSERYGRNVRGLTGVEARKRHHTYFLNFNRQPLLEAISSRTR